MPYTFFFKNLQYIQLDNTHTILLHRINLCVYDSFVIMTHIERYNFGMLIDIV